MATTSSPDVVVVNRAEWDAYQASLALGRKIPRPKGEGGRTTGVGKGGLRLGFQLREASWLPKEKYDTISDTIHMYTWRYCEINKNYSQNEENIPAVVEAARKAHKCLRYYEKDWLTKEIIKSILRHTSTKYKLIDFKFKFPEEAFNDPDNLQREDDVGSDGGDLEVETDNHPDQGSSREDAEEDGPPRKRQKTGQAHGHRELSMDIESDDLFAPQQIDQSASSKPSSSRASSSHPTPSRPTGLPKTYRRSQPQSSSRPVHSRSPEHRLPMHTVLPYDHVTSSQVLRASTRDITLASRSPSPFVHGQTYTSTSLPDVAAQYDRHVTSSPSPKPVAKPRRPDTEKILHEMYKEELVECRNQLRRYKFDKVPMTDRPALWETIKKRIVDDRVHLYLQEVVDIVQYSDRTAFPIAGGAFDKIDQEMKKLEKELIEYGRSKTSPATTNPVARPIPSALPSSSQLDPNGAAKRPGIHNKKFASTLQGTSTPSERAQAALATPKSSHRMPTTPKMTHAQGETPPSATSTSSKAMLAAQNFTRLISDGNNVSPPSSPLRSLANHLNIRSDSEDSGSIYRANEEEEEQEPVSPPKCNKGKGKAKDNTNSDSSLTLRIPKRPIVTENGESKQQGKKSAMLPPAPPSARLTRASSRAQSSAL